MKIDKVALEMVMQTGGEIYNKSVFSLNQDIKILCPVGSTNKYSVSHLELEKALDKAVSNSMKTHDKIGLLLSGGVDSSLLLHLSRELNPDVEIVAYHTDFGLAERSEIEDAARMAHHVDVELKVIDVHPRKQTPYIGESLAMMKTVSYGVPSVYMAFDKMRRDGIQVAFNALGLDELMAGYTIHKRYFDRRKGIMFWPFMKTENKIIRRLMYSLGNDKSFVMRNSFTDSAIDFVKDIESFTDGFYDSIEAPTLWDTIQQWTYVTMKSNFAALVRRGALAHGIEVEFPYMDYGLMRYCHGIMPKDKFNKAPIRWLMRNIYKIPEQIVCKGENWDKIGWGGTPLPYFNSEYFMKEISTNKVAIHEWFTKKAIDKYYGENRVTLQMLIFTKLLEILK